MSVAQRQYLAKVLPWPIGDEPGYVNLHWISSSENYKDGKPFWKARAFRTVAEFINTLEWTGKQPDTRDLYACQSRQSEATEKVGKKNRIFRIGERSQKHALALKAIFLDIDLKDYKSEQELMATFATLIAKTNLPKPSVVVNTTGGFHVYWTFSEILSPERWWPLAHMLVNAAEEHGLKCDSQCTIDSSRILRIPDTLNFKRNKLVRLVHINDFDYSVERIEKALLPYKVTTLKYTNGSHVDFADPEKFPKREPLADDPLSAGISKPHYPLVKLDEVTPECEFIRDAAQRGGVDNANPLWHLTTLLATFMEQGEQLAHSFGCKHPKYTKQETDELYARKIRDKAEKNLGWPSCNTIHGYGSKFCKTCPHFTEGKSPLHFRKMEEIKLPPKPESNPSPPPGVTTTNVLPPGYSRDARGFIQKKTTKEDGSNDYITICEIVIRDAWIQKDPWKLNFAAEPEPGRVEQITLPFEVTGAPVELRKELARQGLTLHDHQVKPVEEFILSWIQTLKHTKDAVVNTSPFGWNVHNGKLSGFVYGGKLFTPTDIKVAQSPDAVTAKGYTPTGDIEPWVNAAKMVTDQQRPALDAIIAGAFAAPLVRFTNQLGLMMSCIGESGIGKSTALDIGMAVWGHPVKAKNLLHDTDNSVMNKVGELRSLPIYWDDLQPDDTRKYARMVFQMSYGKERDRMNQSARRRESGTWQTIMISTSNISLLDHVTQHTKTTAAGVYRIFEIEVASGKGGPGQIAKVDAARLIGKLQENYGMVGQRYAEFLGKNFAVIEDEIVDYQRALDEEVNAENEERLWTSVIACLCIGAKFANEQGYTEINEKRLREFLLDTLHKMRDELKIQAVDLSEEMNVSNILGSFLSAMRSRNTLVTNAIHIAPGKPAPGSILVRGNPSRLEAVYVHIGEDNKRLRIDTTALTEWLQAKDLPSRAVTKALKAKFHAKPVIGRIGGGTEYAVSYNIYMLELNLAELSEDIDIQSIIDDTPTEDKSNGTPADPHDREGPLPDKELGGAGP